MSNPYHKPAGTSAGGEFTSKAQTNTSHGDGVETDADRAKANAQVKTAQVTMKGRNYSVDYYPAREHDPLPHSTHVFRLRKDGSRGRQLTGIPETFQALQLSGLSKK